MSERPSILCWRCGRAAWWSEDAEVYACTGFGCGIDIPAPDADAPIPVARTIPTTCIETIGGDPATAIRLSFQIKVF